MQSLTVKDLMVPTRDYAAVTADATLSEAALTLDKAQKLEQEMDPGRYRDRAVLVVDESGNAIGKLSMLSVLRGLFPQYDRTTGASATAKAASRIGSARLQLDEMEKMAGLWSQPLDNLIDKAGNVKVRELIREFGEDEVIEQSESLTRALHQLINGRYQSLLVTQDGAVIGILRLTDVYKAISRQLRAGVNKASQPQP